MKKRIFFDGGIFTGDKFLRILRSMITGRGTMFSSATKAEAIAMHRQHNKHEDYSHTIFKISVWPHRPKEQHV